MRVFFLRRHSVGEGSSDIADFECIAGNTVARDSGQEFACIRARQADAVVAARFVGITIVFARLPG